MFVRSVAAVCLLCFTIANPAYAESGVASATATAAARPQAANVPIQMQ